MLFVNSLMGAPTPTPYNVYNPLVWRKWLLLLRCMLCLLMHTHLPLRSLIRPEPKSALSWFRVVAVQHDSHLQRQEASRMTNGSLSGLQMYVQLEFVLQTFWKIYLRLANCLMSYFGAIFCLSFFLSVLLFSGSPLSLVTFSIPPSQQSLIEVEPISAYAVFKQTQSTAVLFLPHLPSFSSDLLELFQHPETSANMHAYRLCNPHVRLWLRDTISHCKASHRNDALVPCRGAAVALEASHSCPLHVTATCRVCLNECLLFQ